jgi:hypothetical protein
VATEFDQVSPEASPLCPRATPPVPGSFLLSVDALGVDLQQDVNGVSRPLRYLGVGRQRNRAAPKSLCREQATVAIVAAGGEVVPEQPHRLGGSRIGARRRGPRVLDGTLIPTRDHTTAAPSTNYRYSTNVQVAIDANTRLVIATGDPQPGNRNDTVVYRTRGIRQTRESPTCTASPSPAEPIRPPGNAKPELRDVV